MEGAGVVGVDFILEGAALFGDEDLFADVHCFGEGCWDGGGLFVVWCGVVVGIEAGAGRREEGDEFCCVAERHFGGLESEFSARRKRKWAALWIGWPSLVVRDDLCMTGRAPIGGDVSRLEPGKPGKQRSFFCTPVERCSLFGQQCEMCVDVGLRVCLVVWWWVTV